MDDLISRQALCEYALNQKDKSVTPNDIMRFPSAQPEPHEGTWVYGEDSTADCVDGYRCSQCGFFVPWDYNHKLIDYINDYAYCPNCGADMGGEKDG